MGTTTTRGAGRCRKKQQMGWVAEGGPCHRKDRTKILVRRTSKHCQDHFTNMNILSDRFVSFRTRVSVFCIYLTWQSAVVVEIWRTLKHTILCAQIPIVQRPQPNSARKKEGQIRTFCSFSVISSWNARVPAGYSGLRLQQLKRPPVAQVCGWVMFWRASWMDQ